MRFLVEQADKLEMSAKKEKDHDIIIWRGESARSFSNKYSTYAGVFFGPTKQSVSGWGKPKAYRLISKANIFTYDSSDSFCYNNNLYSKNYKEFKIFDKYADIKTLEYFTKLSQSERATLDKKVQQIAGSEFCWYDLWTWCTQLVARIELEKQGYDGVCWEHEDFGNMIQYQIWNTDVVKEIKYE